MTVLFALLASCIWGAADFLGGLIGKRLPVLSVVSWSQLVGLATVTIAATLFPAEVAPADLVWGASAGLLGATGLFAFYKGLAEGRMAVVSPLAGLVSAVVPLAVGLGLGERPQPTDWVGIVLAFPAIWLVTAVGGEDWDGEHGASYGVFAGMGFGLFFVALAQTGDGSGLWPLVAARAAVGVVALAVARGRPPVPPAGSRLALVAVGMGDVLANVFLLLALRSGLLTVVSVLASLYPAVTVLLAVMVLSEPVRRRQVVGLVLALTAVAMIAA
ncbi:MAG TPA: DMT family transporter [Acidimicrobiia bacterium]|nr:DMT family transporter [Acidimicrobiia bacterium]